MESLPGFLLAGVALAGSPGPNTLSLAAAGAAFGARKAVGYLIGLGVGMICVMAITASGLVGLLLAVPGATPAVTIVAALYFVWLAWRIASAPPLTDQATKRQAPSFVGGFGLSLINPKGYAAMAALFSSFVLVREHVAIDVATKIGVLTLVITAVNVLWLLAGAMLTRFFRDPRTNRIINVVFAALLLGSLVLAVTAA
ncbi:MAG TPA: LysE family translocator [Reyranella sp.]|nr:LysE family translocator [Reyranella sp.]